LKLTACIGDGSTCRFTDDTNVFSVQVNPGCYTSTWEAIVLETTAEMGTLTYYCASRENTSTECSDVIADLTYTGFPGFVTVVDYVGYSCMEIITGGANDLLNSPYTFQVTQSGTDSNGIALTSVTADVTLTLIISDSTCDSAALEQTTFADLTPTLFLSTVHSLSKQLDTSVFWSGLCG
jgi:hypothetical protein